MLFHAISWKFQCAVAQAELFWVPLCHLWDSAQSAMWKGDRGTHMKFCWYCFAFAAQTMWAQQWIAMACAASMIFHAFQDMLSLSQPCQGWLSVVCPSDVRMHKSWKAIRGRHAGSTCDLWYEYHELLAYSLKGTFFYFGSCTRMY